MRRAIDHCPHEFKLIAEGSLGHFSMTDLAAHVGIPYQGQQQQQAGANDDLVNQAMIVAPVAIGCRGIAAPAAVDDAQFAGSSGF